MALSPQRPPHGPSPTPMPAPAVPVLVVTTDDDLWIRLSAAVPGLRLEQYDSVDDLVGTWQSARPAVVLVDARAEADLARAVERLQTHSVALVPVAYVDDVTQPLAAALERKRALFDHVTSSLDPGSTLAVFDRAAEEAQARAAVVPPGVSHSVASSPPPSRGDSGRGLPVVAIGAAVAALVALGGGAWWYSQQRAPATPQTAPATTAVTAAPAPDAAAGDAAKTAAGVSDANAEQIETLLSRARAALRDKRYIDPESDNALAHFRNVLAFDAANGEARQGIDRIAEVLVGRAEAAMAARDYPAALRALEVARNLKPDHPRLAALDAQVNQRLSELSLAQIQAALQANSFERAATLIKQAERSGSVPAATLAQLKQDIGRREARSEISDLVRLGTARIAQGRLLESGNDGARYYLSELQQRPEAAEAYARLKQDYVKRATAEARAASARGAAAEFEQWLAELRAQNVAATQIQALQREASQATPKTTEPPKYAQLANDRIAQRRLLAPENDSAVWYYRQLQISEPRSPQLPTLRDAIGAALVDQARAAFDGGRSAEAQIALDAAREFGVSPSTIAGVQPAAAASRPAATPVAVTAPKLQKALQPDYPPRALQAGTKGWVDVEFVVDAEGRAQNVRAVTAEPARTFDSAAVAAVRRARFEPARTADGTPIAQTTRLRVRFDIQN
jgi:TonB family protein